MKPPPETTVEAALAHAGALLEREPKLAGRQAAEVLAAAPGDPRARFLLGAAMRRCGDVGGARATLEALAAAQPGAPAVHHELGLALAALGEAEAAAAALRRAAALKPAVPEVWRALGDQLILAGDAAGADAAYGEMIRWSVKDPTLMEAAAALCEDRLDVAQRLLRAHIESRPSDVAALRMLAEALVRLGRNGEAEGLLARALELAPSFSAARHAYAIALYRQQKAVEALPHVRALLAEAPADPGYRNLLAAVLAIAGDYDGAIAIYEQALADHPDQPKVWVSYGHALRTAGRREAALAAYGRAVAGAPELGEAWWSIANLKTVRFEEAEVAAMEAQAARSGLPVEDRLHLHYALGKAREDAGDFAAAFTQYAEGARLRRAQLRYSAADTTAQIERHRALYTAPFLAARASGGSPSREPIFVLGLPRSGSTLIEQILASHPDIEGTIELPEIPALARGLASRHGRGEGRAYPEAVAELTPAERAELGETFLSRAALHRRLGRPFFIDKMPNNFLHVGLIRLILPNARIIDARRHPLAAGFSCFKQHFARGQLFSYGLADIGLYYRDYAALMAHFDAVDPGAVIRVIYEDMIADTEGETRRLLDRLGLPFHPACLRFWETERAVRTASSEQVRRPIFRDSLDQWRRFETWLGPLKDALGPTLEDWRGETR